MNSCIAYSEFLHSHLQKEELSPKHHLEREQRNDTIQISPYIVFLWSQLQERLGEKNF